MNDKNKHPRLTVLLAVWIIMTIFLLEGGLWIIHPLPMYPYGTRAVFHQTMPGVAPEFVFERNMFGLRSLSMANATTTAKPARTIRIICVGGSTTALENQATSNTWYGILERELNQAIASSGLTIQIAAYGRSGNKAFETCEWINRNLLPFEPDVVVTLLGINDMCWHDGSKPYDTATIEADIERPVESPFRSHLRIFSQTYRHLSYTAYVRRQRAKVKSGQAVIWNTQKIPILRAKYRKYPYAETVERNPDPILDFTVQVNRILDFLGSNKVAAVVMAQPTLWKATMSDDEIGRLWFHIATTNGNRRPSTAWAANEMSRYNAVQKTVAERHNATFIPLDLLVPHNTSTFFDDCHYTDSGNRRMATQIRPYLYKIAASVAQRKFGIALPENRELAPNDREALK